MCAKWKSQVLKHVLCLLIYSGLQLCFKSFPKHMRNYFHDLLKKTSCGGKGPKKKRNGFHNVLKKTVLKG